MGQNPGEVVSLLCERQQSHATATNSIGKKPASSTPGDDAALQGDALAQVPVPLAIVAVAAGRSILAPLRLIGVLACLGAGVRVAHRAHARRDDVRGRLGLLSRPRAPPRAIAGLLRLPSKAA
eukprot:CAMPEP_0170240732 /NCGR_PEP_ID=MMETSP0116_2-20130129/20128_1 /TAXON_ID=400756 /ORGANISM="Durinskia baltica, Strain CSIRO CS-38" /LENGTH=122 /DNA_ID=CAMNT_0010491559 /DNA_START=131 /DNA_END=495 /DNA_ORIENTATION=+